MLDCPDNQDYTTDTGQSTAVVVWETPTSSDNSGTVPHVSCDPESDTPFKIGETGVVCKAVDGSWNEALCQFLVNITGR